MLARLIPAVLLCALVAACSSSLPDKGRIEAGAGEPLRIGVITTRQGTLTDEGRGEVQAVTLAVEQHGPVAGHAVEVVPADGGCDATGAARSAATFAETPGLLGVVGPLCSEACVAAVGALARPEVVMITPRCTDIVVTRQGYEGVFRTAWTDALQVAAAAKFVHDDLDIGKVFLVNDGTLYGRATRDVFKLFYGESRLAGNEEVAAGEDDGAVVRAIAKSRAGMVYYAGLAPGAARFLQDLRAAGVTLPAIAPDTLKSGDVARDAGAAGEGLYVTDATPERGSGYDTFAAAYRDRFGEQPSSFAAQAYDAALALLGAAGHAARTSGGRLAIDRRGMVAAVAATDLGGATGRLRFLPNGDRVQGATIRVLRLEGGVFVPQRVIELDDEK